MESSKIHLSDAEKELVLNAEIILTKNRIVRKAIELLAVLQEHMVQASLLPITLPSTSPKISRGENYRGLPYAILDYPRISHDNSICFIRTMFWWGHFFSSTLHLSGLYAQQAQDVLAVSYEPLRQREFFTGIGSDPWVHHFDGDHYVAMSDLTPGAFAGTLQGEHIKLAAKWPLTLWEASLPQLLESWKFLGGLITQSVK
ncbi:MAG TPA: hypothetical protein VFZ78_09390 [Flavisolibacter sp.]